MGETMTRNDLASLFAAVGCVAGEAGATRLSVQIVGGDAEISLALPTGERPLFRVTARELQNNPPAIYATVIRERLRHFRAARA